MGTTTLVAPRLGTNTDLKWRWEGNVALEEGVADFKLCRPLHKPPCLNNEHIWLMGGNDRQWAFTEHSVYAVHIVGTDMSKM